MNEPEKIYLTFTEKRLLRYIGKHGLRGDDKRTQTPQFIKLRSYGMIDGYVDDRFPTKYVSGTHLKDCNAYKPAKDVGEYWRYEKELRRRNRNAILRDAFLLVLGSLITLFVQNMGSIVDFITSFFENK